jgi:hypothetical protein
MAHVYDISAEEGRKNRCGSPNCPLLADERYSSPNVRCAWREADGKEIWQPLTLPIPKPEERTDGEIFMMSHGSEICRAEARLLGCISGIVNYLRAVVQDARKSEWRNENVVAPTK